MASSSNCRVPRVRRWLLRRVHLRAEAREAAAVLGARPPLFQAPETRLQVMGLWVTRPATAGHPASGAHRSVAPETHSPARTTPAAARRTSGSAAYRATAAVLHPSPPARATAARAGSTSPARIAR